MTDPRALIPWALIASGVACFGMAFYLTLADAHGVEQPRAGFQLVVCEPTKPCVERGKILSSATACALDAASMENVVPRGTRVGCIKVVKYD